MMEQVERRLAKVDPHNLNKQDFNIVLDFLRLLEEYRKKCEVEGNYSEAKKARGNIDELLRKETVR
jgi:hypothetical protein